MVAEVRLRPEQKRIVRDYKGGKVGVAAVPGSGKTFTLSHLAARLVEQLAAQGKIDGIDRQEVLIVTFTNTAVNSFRSRIAEILQRERGLLPYIGYRVRTLHGLAHDIVRERPSLVGLAEDFQIVDERVADAIIRDVVHSLLGEFDDVFERYLNQDALATDRQRRRVMQRKLPELAVQIGQRFVKHAKDLLFAPDELRAALEQVGTDLPLARFGLAVYEDYQRSLSYRGAVDFDDLVRLAIVALSNDSAYRERLQERWPFVLEDEAQDSSKLQEDMLQLLSGDRNWVRVGDPNQAINTTFTTADPFYLRAFLERDDVEARPLQTSGRSVQPIIDLANWLVRWVIYEHPFGLLRKDTFHEQEIRAAGHDDPQPNPPERDALVYIHYQPGENVSPELELEMVASNLARFLGEEKNRERHTVAVLVPENSRGYKLVEILRQREIPYEELLRSTTETRTAASKLRWVLNYLSNPLNIKALVSLYREVWWRSSFCGLEVEDDGQLAVVLRVLSACRHVEQFLWPLQGMDWLDSADVVSAQPELRADLESFRIQVKYWLQASALPVDQLVLTVTQDLFADPSDIALGYKIAVVLRSVSRDNPEWRLPEFVEELRRISENQRRFIGFDTVERGYVPQPGRVTVATMHAAKGLEWDRVYLMGVNNYSFPSVAEDDEYLSERWFVRDNLNLEAETLEQLDILRRGTDEYREGRASDRARIAYAAERLRLLYVGITRARRHLMISWNMGRFWQSGGAYVKRPALSLVALWEYLRQRGGAG